MSPRILLFESDPAFADEVRNKFEALGLTVDVASDGDQGLDIAAANRPDLILLTIELPRMNGFLVCKKIKKQENLMNVPLLILSSEATQDVFEQHKKLRTRAEDYIHKPIAFADLLERAKRYVDIRSNGASGSGRPSEPADITDLDDNEVILEAEDAESPEVAMEAAAFAEEAVDAVTSAHSSRPMPGSEPPLRGFGAMLSDPITAVSPVDGANAEEVGRLQEEQRRLYARIAELEASAAQFEQRAADAEQEAQSAKQRASSAERSLSDASKKGGASSRELLDLREQLNKKDRELLALRDQVTSRDRQLVEGSDRSLELERAAADLGDKLSDTQRDLEKARETIETLQADKDAARKRFEDAKMRLERAETKTRELSEEAANVKAAHDKAIEALTQQHSLRMMEVEASNARDHDRMRAEHAAAIGELRDSHTAELATQKRAGDAAAAVARDALRAELTAETERRLAEAQQKHDGIVTQALAAHQNELQLTRKGLEEKHEAELRQANDRAQQDMARVGRALGEAETRIQLLQDQLEEAENGRTDLSARLAKVTAERDQKTEISEELQAQLSRLAVTRSEEEQVLDRARKALAIALSLLDEHRRSGG